MKQIYIKNKDLGWWSEQPITVQRFETIYNEDDFDKELVWCNHAGFEEKEVENEYHTPDARTLEWTDRILICPKCGAYKMVWDEYWQDSPIQGVYDE